MRRTTGGTRQAPGQGPRRAEPLRLPSPRTGAVSRPADRRRDPREHRASSRSAFAGVPAELTPLPGAYPAAHSRRPPHPAATSAPASRCRAEPGRSGRAGPPWVRRSEPAPLEARQDSVPAAAPPRWRWRWALRTGAESRRAAMPLASVTEEAPPGVVPRQVTARAAPPTVKDRAPWTRLPGTAGCPTAWRAQARCLLARQAPSAAPASARTPCSRGPDGLPPASTPETGRHRRRREPPVDVAWQVPGTRRPHRPPTARRLPRR